MNPHILDKIDKLIREKKIEEAQFNLSKLGQEFHKNPQYLYLRSVLLEEEHCLFLIANHY